MADSNRQTPESDATDAKRRRHVRSFVRREGRATPAQLRALDELWPRFGLDAPREPLDLAAIYGREAPLTLEIGFGNGELLATLAARNPQRIYLGVEVHRPGVGHLLLALDAQALDNVRVICHDAVEVLEHGLAPASLDQVLIFFPDPWPKKRHHKRRLVQPGFVELIAGRLRPGGMLHVATDWENYAAHIFETLTASARFENTVIGTDHRSGAVPRPDSRPVTKFETRGRRLGHEVFDYLFVRR